MKIVKVEDLHCDAGWRLNSFLKRGTGPPEPDRQQRALSEALSVRRSSFGLAFAPRDVDAALISQGRVFR